MLDAFQRHGVQEVYGFVNAAKLDPDPTLRAVLDAWIAAGHPLGNHQDRHDDLHRVPAQDFIAGIQRNEPLLRTLAGAEPEQSWRVFRYPFLHEGLTLEARDAVRAHLATSGYRIAPVTIDPYDWAYNDAYGRCLEKGDSAATDAVRQQFLSEARAKLRWAVAQGQALEGRPVRHVLLLHQGLIDADTIDALLTEYERLGVRWIPLSRALEDPIYAVNPNLPYGGMYLFQLHQLRGVPTPPPPLTPTALLAALCR